MYSERVRYNEVHPVGFVLKSQCSLSRAPKKEEDVDLRFLHLIRLGDTYNGEDNPVDGVAYKAVLYGNRIVWEEHSEYISGSCEQRWENGNPMYHSLYFSSRIYLKILEIGRAMYFRENIRHGDDIFYINSGHLELLETHPQFREMVEDFGLELLSTLESGRFQVKVTKFYSPDVEES